MSLATIKANLRRYRDWVVSAAEEAGNPKTCFCVGPQDGNPVCPCRMPALRIQHGRYVEIIDHGPAPADDLSTD